MKRRTPYHLEFQRRDGYQTETWKNSPPHHPIRYQQAIAIEDKERGLARSRGIPVGWLLCMLFPAQVIGAVLSCLLPDLEAVSMEEQWF